jgi:uncharacterized iron-regulated membrane protein
MTNYQIMLKTFIGKIHLWLGLASGIIVFIVSVTGCIYVFSKEITEVRRKQAMYVEKQTTGTVPVSQLWEKAQAHLGPGKKIGWANIYNNPQKSWVFYSYQNNPDAITYFGMIDHYESVYVDPYSGKIIAVYDEKLDFFNVVKFLHWSLLFTTPIGQPIVGWSTLIFVVLLITGLVLWWPKSIRSAKNLFWIRWQKSTPGHRKNYDLHNVLGFYSMFFALIIAFTGMVWSFKWFQALVYVLAAGTTSPPNQVAMQSTPASLAVVKPVDQAFETARKRYADAAGFRLSPPADSLGAINIYVQQKEGLYYQTHQLQVDQYSGELLKERRHEEKNTGEKLITANYDIHVGAILGLPGKIIAFLVSLICGSLPVTGFYVWWNKRKQRQKPLFG